MEKASWKPSLGFNRTKYNIFNMVDQGMNGSNAQLEDNLHQAYCNPKEEKLSSQAEEDLPQGGNELSTHGPCGGIEWSEIKRSNLSQLSEECVDTLKTQIQIQTNSQLS